MDGGQLVIKGKFDGKDIEMGIDNVKVKMSQFNQDTKSAGLSLKAGADAAGALAKQLVVIGTTGVAAITGLAAISPAVAPQMAKIKMELFKLGNELGLALQPVFAAVGNELIPAIIESINSGGFISTVSDIATEAVSDIAKAIKGQLGEIEGLVPKVSGMASGAAAGYALMGWPGLFVGAALGYAATSESAGEKAGTMLQDAGIGSLIGALGGGLTSILTGLPPQATIPIGAAAGGLVGAATGAPLRNMVESAPDFGEKYFYGSQKDVIMTFIDTIRKMLNRKDIEFNTAHG